MPRPEAVTVRVVGVDAEGEAIARPVTWPAGEAVPTVFMRPERRTEPALVPGDVVVASLRRTGVGRFEGRTLRRVEGTAGRLVGVFRATAGGGGRIEPADRRVRADWRVAPGETGGASDGEVVVATPLPHAGLGLKPVRVLERVGPAGAVATVSLLAIASHGLRQAFPAEALAEAGAAGPATLAEREDFRAVPLVTIDGADARDFDDAVWAEPEADGFRLLVAVADVAHYVAAGGALDREARARGNSVYFPDRVVPMLPEALSAGWCSLLPGEERACVMAELWIDGQGRLVRHRFVRGLMRSAARLTYEQVAADPAAWRHLFAASRLLLAARTARGALDLEAPEREVVLREGVVAAVRPRARLESHRLVEEFMILANVAAAETLTARRAACVYRVHAAPTAERLEGLRATLEGLGFGLPERVAARDLAEVLGRAEGAVAGVVQDAMLRAQSAAAYSVGNVGHFGLALPRYAHFTSPIRRYADLLVHRALLGEAVETGAWGEWAEAATGAERRAVAAERAAGERYAAFFLAERTGAFFEARVAGVQRFGIFVTVVENGASGLVKLSGLADDFWSYDPSSQTLAGRSTGMSFRPAQPLCVRLAEVNTLTGGLVFELARA